MPEHIHKENVHGDHFDFDQDGKMVVKFIAPSFTITERNALSAVNGMIIYNTDDKVFNKYEDDTWKTM